MKKTGFLCLLLFAALFLSLVSCKEKETSDYEREILGAITDGIGPSDRLSPFSEEICVPDDSAVYDDTLILAKYAGLFNETDKEIVYAKGITEKIYPASMTKVMTALLTAENCEDLDALVTVTEEALEGLSTSSSSAGLAAGERYTVRDLLSALLIPSGNDAANTLAVYIGGSIPEFVRMMNARAKELGMLDTHFVNANGLHDRNHYTTVYDLYLLTRKFIGNRTLSEIASSRDATGAALQPDGSYVVKKWRSTNSILLGYTEIPETVTVLAAKTGYTVSAGRCMLMGVRGGDGDTYVAVIANAASHDILYQEMTTLLNIIAPEAERTP